MRGVRGRHRGDERAGDGPHRRRATSSAIGHLHLRVVVVEHDVVRVHRRTRTEGDIAAASMGGVTSSPVTGSDARGGWIIGASSYSSAS